MGYRNLRKQVRKYCFIRYDFYDFRHQFGTKVFQVTTKSTVTDYDVNDSNELLVGAGQDGSFVAWNLQSGLELRRIQFAGKCFDIFDTLYYSPVIQ